MVAATKTAIERKTERRPKTRPRSSSWPDLTNIKVVAVTRLSGTWIILGYNHSVKDLDVDGGCCYAVANIGGCNDDHHYADNDEAHSK